MSEIKPPSNFITPSSIDNLSIAGASVWLICLTVASLNSDINSFWIRIIAICISAVWSLSLFLKNKRWNRSSNYIIIIVNAVLIYINAAGINTVTRQSPFEGYGVKTELKNVKSPIVKSAIFNLSNQPDWYPDYEMIQYIDTLKEDFENEKLKTSDLQNQFAYLKDNIDKITDDETARNNLKKILKNFGKPFMDSSNFSIMKNELQFKIDSLNSALKFKNQHPITRTTYYELNGKQISASDYVDTLQKKNYELQMQLRKYTNKSPIINAIPDRTIIIPNQTHEDSLKGAIQ